MKSLRCFKNRGLLGSVVLSLGMVAAVPVQASVWTYQTPTNAGVDVVINWSNTSNHGEYKVCIDSQIDSAPCSGATSTVHFTSDKPFTASLSACSSYRVKAKIQRKLWGIVSWDGQGVTQIQTGPAVGQSCNPVVSVTPDPVVSLSATANTVSAAVMTYSQATSVRTCIRALSASQPVFHPELCKRSDWSEVLNGYDVIVPGAPDLGHNEGYQEQSQRIADAKRITSPHAVFNQISFGNLHSKCWYKVATVIYDGQTILSDTDIAIKTGGNGGIFGGWSCFFGVVSNGWFGMAVADGDVSVLSQSDDAKLAYAFMTSNEIGQKITLDYMETVQRFYAENPDVAAEHHELAQKLGLAQVAAREEVAGDPLAQVNSALFTALSHPEFFLAWQKSLSGFDVSYMIYLLSFKDENIDRYVKEILSDRSLEDALRDTRKVAR